MSSSTDQHTMKVTVVATQELCIDGVSPTLLAAFPETLLESILEQLTRRGLNLTSIQVASNPDNLCDLQVGQELASAAMKDSAVFHMLNYNNSLQAWNRLPNNASNKTPPRDKEKAPATRPLAQKPITWFYDPIPQVEQQPALSSTGGRLALSSTPNEDAQALPDNGPAPATSILGVQEPMEEDTTTPRRTKGGGKRKGRKKLGTHSPKRATKLAERARILAQKEGTQLEEQDRSGKGTLKPEKRMVAHIHDRRNFASRVQRIGMTLALYKFEQRRQQKLKKRLAKASESRWKGQPSDLTEDDKVDVITKELDKAFEKM